MSISTRRCLIAAAVAGAVTSLFTGTLQRASAAPDDTLGMAIMFAVVDSGGNLVRGAGVTAASRLQEGWYLVNFERPITTCGYYATPGTLGLAFTTDAHAIQITADAGGGSSFIWVRTQFSSNNTADDMGFYLLVFCPH